jgi:hypothetical protein
MLDLEPGWNETQREIRNLAAQRGMRVPDRKEALVMTRLLIPAQSTVCK